MHDKKNIVGDIASQIVDTIELTAAEAQPVTFKLIPGANLTRIALDKVTADIDPIKSDKKSKWGLYKTRDGQELFLDRKKLKAYNVAKDRTPLGEKDRENLTHEIAEVVEKTLQQAGVDVSLLSPNQIENIVRASGHPLKADSKDIAYKAHEIAEKLKSELETAIEKEAIKIKKEQEEEELKKKQAEEKLLYSEAVVAEISQARLQKSIPDDITGLILKPLAELISKDNSVEATIIAYDNRRTSRLEGFKDANSALRNIELANDNVVKRTVTKAQVTELKNAQDTYERLSDREKLGLLTPQEAKDLENAKRLLDDTRRQVITTDEMVQYILGNKAGIEMMENKIANKHGIETSELSPHWRNNIEIKDGEIVIQAKTKDGRELKPISMSTKELKEVFGNMIELNTIDSDLSPLDARNEKVLHLKMTEARDKLEVIEANDKKLEHLNSELQLRKDKLGAYVNEKLSTQLSNFEEVIEYLEKTPTKLTAAAQELLEEVEKIQEHLEIQELAGKRFKEAAFQKHDIIQTVVRVHEAIEAFSKANLRKVASKDIQDRSGANLSTFKEEFIADQQAKKPTVEAEKSKEDEHHHPARDKWQKQVKGETPEGEKTKHTRIKQSDPSIHTH